jgi:hypothetical protein
LILALAESLTAPGRVSPQGVARIVVLLDDNAGALFGPKPAGTLSLELRSARRSLELGPMLSADDSAAASGVTPPAPMPWGI